MSRTSNATTLPRTAPAIVPHYDQSVSNAEDSEVPGPEKIGIRRWILGQIQDEEDLFTGGIVVQRRTLFFLSH